MASAEQHITVVCQLPGWQNPVSTEISKLKITVKSKTLIYLFTRNMAQVAKLRMRDINGHKFIDFAPVYLCFDLFQFYLS